MTRPVLEFVHRRSFVMQQLPTHNNDSSISDLHGLHRERGEALLHRQAQLYSGFHWDDAIIFIFNHRMTAQEMRRQLPLLAAGSEAITLEFPPADNLMISESGDAATTSFQWKTRILNSKGVVIDRVNYETNVWYRRNGV